VIPVFEPYIGDEEAEAVAAAVRRGEISGSFGEETPNFEREFAEYLGVKHGVAVTSGTAALHLATAAAGIGPGDEVLVSASTHVSTALAPFHCGAHPIPVDAEPETGNLDLDVIESRITPRTKAIIPAHLFGHPIDMDRLLQIAQRHSLVVIEDCAEAHGATVRGRMAGSFGDMACFSFYANKVITTGEGGMVMTSDDALAERLRLLRDVSSGTPRFVHEEAGFNFRMTGYQAAMGRVQLRKIEAIIEQKRRIAHAYDRAFADIPWVRTPIEARWARNVYWMYVVVLGDEFPVDRDDLMSSLRAAGIDTRTHFCPMNLQPFLRRQPAFQAIPCPVAERLWRRGLYLPSSITLSEDEIAAIVGQVRSPVLT
jgi:perosamine synthetase